MHASGRGEESAERDAGTSAVMAAEQEDLLVLRDSSTHACVAYATEACEKNADGEAFITPGEASVVPLPVEPRVEAHGSRTWQAHPVTFDESPDPMTARSFRCKQCSREYASSDSVRKHARQHHPEWLKEIGQGCPSLYCTTVVLTEKYSDADLHTGRCGRDWGSLLGSESQHNLDAASPYGHPQPPYAPHTAYTPEAPQAAFLPTVVPRVEDPPSRVVVSTGAAASSNSPGTTDGSTSPAAVSVAVVHAWAHDGGPSLEGGAALVEVVEAEVLDVIDEGSADDPQGWLPSELGVGTAPGAAPTLSSTMTHSAPAEAKTAWAKALGKANTDGRSPQKVAAQKAAERRALFDDCGQCNECKNMKKFGGPGSWKHACTTPIRKHPLSSQRVTRPHVGLDGPIVSLPTKTISPAKATSEVPDDWLQCDRCGKWRKLHCLPNLRAAHFSALKWFCEMNPDEAYASCEATQEDEAPDSEEEDDVDDAVVSDDPVTDKLGAAGADDVYEVHKLLEMRKVVRTGRGGAAKVTHATARQIETNNCFRQFLVRWKGYTMAESTWEDEDNIIDKKLIDAFDREQRKREQREQREVERQKERAERQKERATLPQPTKQGASSSQPVRRPVGRPRLDGHPPKSSKQFVAPSQLARQGEAARAPAQPPKRSHQKKEVVKKKEAAIVWINCDQCSKWRVLRCAPPLQTLMRAQQTWHCGLNPDDAHNTCEAPQESEGTAEAAAKRSLNGKHSAPSSAAPRPPSVKASCLKTNFVPRSAACTSRVGVAWQAELPPPCLPSAGALAAPLEQDGESKPDCHCGNPCVWWSGRWWCERGGDGCGFEAAPPPCALTPLCSCGERAVWVHERWWCSRHRAFGDEASMGGCGFEMAPEPSREEPELISEDAIDTLRTAWARPFEVAKTINSWVDDLCFVADVGDGCGLGLVARTPLRPGQVVAEYGGPRLPLSMLQDGKGEYALEVSNTQTFIDGGWDNSPLDASDKEHQLRYPSVFANHSGSPNARFERRTVSHRNSSTLQVRFRMVLVASERIRAGGEIRVDYESGNAYYWQGRTPLETDWRSHYIEPPPPQTRSAPDPGCDVPLIGRNGAFPWEGDAGGDSRLRRLVPLLYHGNPSEWTMIASHLPGRSGHECRSRWSELVGDTGGDEEVLEVDDGEEVARGMRLHLSKRNQTGYVGVTRDHGRFKVAHYLDGKYTHLGSFPTAVEGATVYAKHVQSLGLDVDDRGNDLAWSTMETGSRVTEPGGLERVTEAEGLRLHLAEEGGRVVKNKSGYRGVSENASGSFEVKFSRDGKITYLGSFGTAVKAAVAYATYMQSLGLDAPHIGHDERDARVIEAEGLQLHLAEEGRSSALKNRSGYVGVRETRNGRFEARLLHASESLGTFDTAVEAAVAYARNVQSLGLDEEDYVERVTEADKFGERVTEVDGLRLHLAEERQSHGPINRSGYLGVRALSSGRFVAQHNRHGNHTSLGTFESAVEAAVAYAKHVQSFGLEEGLEEEDNRERVTEADKFGERVTEVDGLRLHLAEERQSNGRKSRSGYVGVREVSGGRFQAEQWLHGKHRPLGTFNTAVEAAVAYARNAQSRGAHETGGMPVANHSDLNCSGDEGSGAQTAPAARAPRVKMFNPKSGKYLAGQSAPKRTNARKWLESHPGWRLAQGESLDDSEEGAMQGHLGVPEGPEQPVVLEAEGMRLHLSDGPRTGYRGVHPHGARFQAKYSHNGKRHHLGTFGTAVEAAVAVAKHLKRLGVEAPSGAPHSPLQLPSLQPSVETQQMPTLSSFHSHLSSFRPCWVQPESTREAVETAITTDDGSSDDQSEAHNMEEVDAMAEGDHLEVDGVDEWLDSGHKWLGQRVRRFHASGFSDGVITHWAAPREGFDDDDTVWHMLHDDDEEEDLVAYEVVHALNCFRQRLSVSPGDPDPEGPVEEDDDNEVDAEVEEEDNEVDALGDSLGLPLDERPFTFPNARKRKAEDYLDDASGLVL